MSWDNNRQRTLLLGTGPFSQSLMTEIVNRPHCGYQIVGVVAEKDTPAGFCHGFPLVGSIEQLRDIIRAHKPDRIVVALSTRQEDMADHQLLEARVCQNICVEDAEAVYEKLTGMIPIESLTPSGMIYSNEFEPSQASLSGARMFSFLVAAVSIVLLAPLMALVALLIKLDSRGPVLFVQQRVGLDGKSFNLLKFRTMRPTEDRVSEWAGDNDHRITRIGRILRKFRLDELPQFFNVLFSDMNLVGPRPHPASNFRLFVLVSRNMPECGVQIPYYSLRLRVRPGITGWAQVRYKYANNLNEEIEKLKYDLYYVKHYSLWLDLRILMETVRTVVRGHEVPAETADPSAHDVTSRTAQQTNL
jgi:exopolysaccharide biosynthesis polyprenyl glycosylphosphotransferase